MLFKEAIPTTLNKHSQDTSPSLYQSLHAYVIPPSPLINVDCDVLLAAAKFNKCNFYFNIDRGRRGKNAEIHISCCSIWH